MSQQLPAFTVVDDFCPMVDEVRESALASGFGAWRPNKGKVGSSVYDGMSFHGKHAMMVHSLSLAVGQPVIPNSMFFRVTNKHTEKAYIHSDRYDGSYTCVAYLSSHKECSGTSFFRHIPTGLREMPCFKTMAKMRGGKALQKDMISGDPLRWEILDTVRGIYNRALVFRAPLFHARYPKHGIGSSDVAGRMVWVCHFELNS